MGMNPRWLFSKAATLLLDAFTLSVVEGSACLKKVELENGSEMETEMEKDMHGKWKGRQSDSILKLA